MFFFPTRYWPDPKWFKSFRFLSNKIEKKQKQSKQYLSICKNRTIESSQIIFNKGLSYKLEDIIFLQISYIYLAFNTNNHLIPTWKQPHW